MFPDGLGSIYSSSCLPGSRSTARKRCTVITRGAASVLTRMNIATTLECVTKRWEFWGILSGLSLLMIQLASRENKISATKAAVKRLRRKMEEIKDSVVKHVV